MLPPLDPELLERNPRFRALHENLTSTKLNSDGSTKDPKKQKAREGLQEVSASRCLSTQESQVLTMQQELQNSRVEVAKAMILRDSLRAISSTSTDLPSEVRITKRLLQTPSLTLTSFAKSSKSSAPN